MAERDEIQAAVEQVAEKLRELHSSLPETEQQVLEALVEQAAEASEVAAFQSGYLLNLNLGRMTQNVQLPSFGSTIGNIGGGHAWSIGGSRAGDVV